LSVCGDVELAMSVYVCLSVCGDVELAMSVYVCLSVCGDVELAVDIPNGKQSYLKSSRPKKITI